MKSTLIHSAEKWLEELGWEPFQFQREVWTAMDRGDSGLLHAPTGMGKTLAVWFGALSRIQAKHTKSALQILWITPLRALAADTLQALQAPLSTCMPDITVELRTGDTAGHVKQKQEKKLPTTLITTPESLTLLLTRPKAQKNMENLSVVIVDEWHELLGSKRGVQTELALARLRRYSPQLITWGLSATLGNLEEALNHLLGINLKGKPVKGRLIQGNVPKEIHIDALLPKSSERFPWAGHLGLKMLPQVVLELENVSSSLVFTNTRSQCELWHRSINDSRPDWKVGLHHGSLAKEERETVETGLKNGEYKVVVCTSSLDLGVDFSPVERVLQIGSPKGVARLLQRAGRSGHGPGRISRITCVPASILELIEAAAARDATLSGRIEGRNPYICPLDALCQHMVSMALSDGFKAEDLLEEVRSTASFSDLSESEWQWLLEFLHTGGKTLSAYPEYKKLRVENGVYLVSDSSIAKRHRMSIGTIVSDASIQIRYAKGPKLGSVEESFISRLRPSDTFLFSGRALELLRVNNLTAYVKSAKTAGAIPVWQGGRMPLSNELADAVCCRIDEAVNGIYNGEEMQCVKPVLTLQASWSALPRTGELLLERIKSREGYHLFLYPFAGRLVHEGLAALLAFRLAQIEPLTFSWAVNDYGIELLCPSEIPLDFALDNGLFTTTNLSGDLLESMNAAELAKSRFRQIARVAGLVFEGYPGKGKTARQIQATSSLLFDVFARYDPEQPLFQQASREVLERQLEQNRLHETLVKMEKSKLLITEPERFTPFAFPLLVDRLRERLTTEKLSARLERMLSSLERHAG